MLYVRRGRAFFGQDHRHRSRARPTRCVAVMEGDASVGHSERGGRPDDPFGGGLHQDGRAAGRPGREAPGRHQPREHDLLDQAVHGAQVLRSDRRAEDGPLQGRRGVERRRADRGRGQGLLAARDLRDDPPEDAATPPRPISARRSPRPSSPFPPTSTTPSARPPRTRAASRASRSCASSTSPPRPRWPTASTRRRTRRSRSTTSAAAPSTSRSSRSARAWSR